MADSRLISQTEQESLRKLFNDIDINSDGTIDVVELKTGLKRMGIPTASDTADKILKQSDINRDNKINCDEFITYVYNQEKELEKIFKELDKNKDGVIGANEIVECLKEFGVSISNKEATRLLNSIDKDGSLRIDWSEWRDYLRLRGVDNMSDIVRLWRHATFIDIGENLVIPDDFTEEELRTGMWWRQLVAGGGAGIVSRTATAPLDRLKIFIQVQASSARKFNVISSLRGMIAEGGVASLWRGNGINVVKIAPESAMKIMLYENCKRLLANDPAAVTVSERFTAGFLAGVVAQSIIYPLEVLKTRTALRMTGEYSSVYDCASKLWTREGPRVFYRGYVPSTLGIIPYAGIDLAIYETLKRAYLKAHPNEPNPGVLLSLACGTISCTCGQLAGYPLALIRTRMQAAATLQAPIPPGFIRLAKGIVKDEGILGLYRGMIPNFLKVLPAVTTGYIVCERLKGMLGVQSL